MSEQDGAADKLRSCFKECVSGDVLIFQMMGLYSMGNIFKKEKPKWHYWETLPFIVAMGILIFGTTFDINKMLDVITSDFMLSIEILSAVVTTILSISKGLRLWAYRREIYDMLNKSKLRWYAQASRESITSSMIKTAHTARIFRIFYATSVASAVAGYATGPYVDIRRLKGENVSEFSKKRAIDTTDQLKAFVEEHLDLFENVEEVQALYNPIIFTTVLSNGINLCSCVYSLQYRMGKDCWGDIQKNVCHAASLLMQTFLYCGFAQRLSDETIDIRQALYDSSWFDLSEKTKVGIVIIMSQTQKEFVYSAYNLIQLNMPQVTTIVTAAMRYFTLLRSIG